MNIKEMTEIELKALCFDELAKVEVAQNNIRIITQELSLRRQIPEPKKTPESANTNN